jgi:hypothetical protein
VTARLIRNSYNVSAVCPTCEAVTSFEQKQTVVVNGEYYVYVNGQRQAYSRVLYVLSQCAGCTRGGFAAIPDRGNAQNAVLESFFPFSVKILPRFLKQFPRTSRLSSARQSTALLNALIERLPPSFVPFWRRP